MAKLNEKLLLQVIKDSEMVGQKKIGRNTYAGVDECGTAYVKLHATRVVQVKSDGSVILNSGGWQTSTTKDRINQVLRALNKSEGVWQKKFEWFLGEREFEDGMKV